MTAWKIAIRFSATCQLLIVTIPFAILGGLNMSMLLTLVIIHNLYVILFGVKYEKSQGVLAGLKPAENI